jgi:hypothetical protein
MVDDKKLSQRRMVFHIADIVQVYTCYREKKGREKKGREKKVG